MLYESVTNVPAGGRGLTPPLAFQQEIVPELPMAQRSNASSATLICFQVSAGASVTIIAAWPLAQSPAAQQARRPSALSAHIVL